MTRTLLLGATTLMLSAGAASAQAVYVAPGYDYAAPAYVAPAPAAPIYAAPPVVYRYYGVPRTTVAIPAPVYDYAPGYFETVTTEPGW
jgi:hypothetical protein